MTSSSAATATFPSPQAVGWRRWAPNAITLSRIVLASIFFGILSSWDYSQPGPRGGFVHPNACFVAGAVFILGAITDAADGYLARRWGAISRFGRIMDPFADKILVVGAFVMLAGPAFQLQRGTYEIQISGVRPWMVVVILGRELLVTSIRAVLEAEGRDFSAVWSGKAKMILQAVAVPTILITLGLFEVGPGTFGRWLIDITVWTTMLATVLSGWPYIRRGMLAFASTPPQN
jgi:CDP-diacylglycerol--glycerol-3-phosphate 3-phosphatidyltransferase